MEEKDSLITSIVQRLDERGAKIDALKRLLKDPDLADTIAEVLKDGRISGATPRKRPAAKPKAGENTLRQTIVALASTLPQPFTAKDVLRALQERQFPLGSDPNTSVGNALYKLTKARKIRRSTQSKGGTPNKYRALGRKPHPVSTQNIPTNARTSPVPSGN